MDDKQQNRIIKRIEIAYRKQTKQFNKRLNQINPDKIRKIMKESRIGMQCQKCLNKGGGRYCCKEHGKYYRSITNNFYGTNYPYSIKELRRASYDSEAYKISCPFCGKKERWTQMSVDHILPITRGGLEFDRDNLQWACLHCNIKKNNHMPEEIESKRKVKEELTKAIYSALQIKIIVDKYQEKRQLRLAKNITD